MRADDDRRPTVKTFVSALIVRVAKKHQGRPLLIASCLRPRPRHRPALGLSGNMILAALAQAWSVTTISVVMLSAAVSLAPMWDRAIFAKSLLEALNTDPEMLQLAVAVTDAAPACSLQATANNSRKEGN